MEQPKPPLEIYIVGPRSGHKTELAAGLLLGLYHAVDLNLHAVACDRTVWVIEEDFQDMHHVKFTDRPCEIAIVHTSVLGSKMNFLLPPHKTMVYRGIFV